jgi:hypothetical protein
MDFITRIGGRVESISILLKSMKWRKKPISTFIRSYVRPLLRASAPDGLLRDVAHLPPPLIAPRPPPRSSSGTHRGLASTIAPQPPLQLLIRNAPRRPLRHRAADLAPPFVERTGDHGPAATSPSAPHLERTGPSPSPPICSDRRRRLPLNLLPSARIDDVTRHRTR